MTPGRGRPSAADPGLELTLSESSPFSGKPPGMKGVWEVLESGQWAFLLPCS